METTPVVTRKRGEPSAPLRWNGKCHGCGQHHTGLFVRTGEYRGHLGANGALFNSEDAQVETTNGEILWESDYRLTRMCACGARVFLYVVRGKYRAAKKCTARCTAATGHDCECSCAGKNHGAHA